MWLMVSMALAMSTDHLEVELLDLEKTLNAYAPDALPKARALTDNLGALEGVPAPEALAGAWFSLGLAGFQAGDPSAMREGFGTACAILPSYSNPRLVLPSDTEVLEAWRLACESVERTGTLEITGAPPDSRLFLDGATHSNPVFVGRHLVQLIGDHPTKSQLVAVRPEEEFLVDFQLHEALPTALETPPTTAAGIEPVADGPRPRRSTGWFVAGGVLAVASAGLAVATAVHWNTSTTEAQLWVDEERFREAAGTHQLLQGTTFAIGGASLTALGIGIVSSF